MDIPTSHGTLSVIDIGSDSIDAPAVVFLHGNSSRKEVFEAQLGSALRGRYRLVALDLPGHGGSQDAADPQRSYTIPGYAAAVREVLDRLGIQRPILVGWSLGGHIAIELMAATPRPLSVVITGTPPFAKSRESIGEAFRPTPAMLLTGKPEFTDEEALVYARMTTTPQVRPAIRTTRRRGAPTAGPAPA